ncbi:MAG: EAL domain-containing protein [Nitrospirae bacterium]|nr:EAL domain-containing protein [Nitrospirota bacterium]
MQQETYLIGRQPILNRNEEAVAYELLFRSAASRDRAEFSNVTHASASVIINTLSGFGLEQIIGKHKGFINLDHNLFMSEAIEILPRERVVLELLETVKVTPELVKRCQALKDSGFILALDDHTFDPAYEELYKIVDIIKVDLLQSPFDQMARMIESFRPYPLKLLAEKVETRDEYLRCLNLGFEFFQGYYFAKPTVIEKKKFDEAGSALMKLMRLLAEDAELNAIEQAFRGSPGLTYKLLLLVNSVSLGIRQKIQSIRHAVTILGRNQLKRWSQLAMFASDDSRGLENPLVEMAAVRATFMEQLACRHPLLKHNQEYADQAFMIGILSLLETIYNISMDEIVTSLNAPEEFKDALISRKGPLGQLLDLAEMIERNFSGITPDQFEKQGFSQDDILAALRKAYSWSGEIA